jgi:hypothetical protein
MSKDINVHITTETDKAKVDEYGNAVEATGKKVNEAGGHAEGLTGKMNLLGNAITSVKSYLLGFAGITTLFTFFNTWLEWVNKIKKAQEELVESTKALDQAANSLASQANVMGVPGGVEAAREQVLAIQTAGRLGSFELAKGVATAAHSAFGTSGQLLTPEQLAIAGSVGEFAQQKGLSPSSLGDLFKLLAKMGVTNTQEADRRIQQLSIASEGEPFDQFITGGVRSIIPAIAAGASPEMAMAQYANAMKVPSARAGAAEKTKQTSEMMLQPEIAAAIGDGFADLPYDQKITAFSQWVSQSSPQQLMAAGVSSGEVLPMKALYSPEQLPYIQKVLSRTKSATGEHRQADLAVWHETLPSKIIQIEAKDVRAEATATPDERVGMALIKAGKTEWNRIVRDKKEDWLWKDEFEKDYKTVWEPLWKRYLALTDATQQGKLPGDAEQEVEDVGRYLYEFMPGYVPEHLPGSSPVTPAKVGRANAMLEPMERQAGITINYNYNSGPVFARPGVDPTPRVAPGDI